MNCRHWLLASRIYDSLPDELDIPATIASGVVEPGDLQPSATTSQAITTSPILPRPCSIYEPTSNMVSSSPSRMLPTQPLLTLESAWAPSASVPFQRFALGPSELRARIGSYTETWESSAVPSLQHSTSSTTVCSSLRIRLNPVSASFTAQWLGFFIPPVPRSLINLTSSERYVKARSKLETIDYPVAWVFSLFSTTVEASLLGSKQHVASTTSWQH